MDAITNWPDSNPRERPKYNAVIEQGDLRETIPVVEPVTVAEVKEELQIDFTDHDVYLGKLITRMRQGMERYCGISMVPKEVVSVLLKNELGNIELPYGPVNAATAGDVILTDMEANTIENATFRGDHFMQLITQYDLVWANYDVGYGGATLPLPDDMKDALIRIIAHVFTHRADEGMDTNEVIRKFAHQFKRGSWLL
jgi:uncharacterized phiE125 gp8 family phage protein